MSQEALAFRRWTQDLDGLMILRKKVENDVHNGTLSINERNGVTLRNNANDVWILSKAQVQLIYGGTVRDVVDYVKYIDKFFKEEQSDKSNLEFI